MHSVKKISRPIQYRSARPSGTTSFRRNTAYNSTRSSIRATTSSSSAPRRLWSSTAKNEAKSAPKPILLSEYKPPSFTVNNVDLEFTLDEEETTVKCTTQYTAASREDKQLKLFGEHMKLVSIALDGRNLKEGDYKVDDKSLTLEGVPEQFKLEVVTKIQPQSNTSLMGLYKSRNMFCTQCEPEGFRKITYFLDRPDVMTQFETTIIADKNKYPVLLSNGNKTAEGVRGDKHFVKWTDPWKKPSYLFALVAGNLARLEDTFTTMSGRNVKLHIYADKENLSKCKHAMESLKKSMKWDEETYKREYDLDLFNIVAVPDFNMGAMENKSLNIFNTKYVLADEKTATDADFDNVERVIGHEYFHNWTGNRITLRDWFQLSLKEGLTVFREQQFAEDMSSKSVKRIDHINKLRMKQFAEDAGPMAHPVRPASYIQINNFYTMTVYEKGAEVIRVLKTVIGEENFQKGIQLYFQRHDGQAVTTDHLVQCMEDASGVNLSQFKLWYSQSGTPEIQFSSHYDSAAQKYTLHLSQSCPSTPGQPASSKQPFHIPVSVGLLGKDDNELSLQLEGESPSDASTTKVLQLTKQNQTFVFNNVKEQPVLSLLRDFSAPVKITTQQSKSDLEFLAAHDTDPFNRWEALQQLSLDTILKLIEQIQQNKSPSVDDVIINVFKSTLTSQKLDSALKAHALVLPSEQSIAQHMKVIDPDAIHHARYFLKKKISSSLRDLFLDVYNQNHTNVYASDAQSKAQRSLKNVCLGYLEDSELCMKQFKSASNMTDQFAALAVLSNIDSKERVDALEMFHNQWKSDELVMDKWFGLQATSKLATVESVKKLQQNPLFNIKNPNKVYATLGGFFLANQLKFHEKSGSGYAFLTESVLQLDKLNPQVTARIVQAFAEWKKFDQERQNLMKQNLQQILKTSHLSSDVYEIVSKTLA